MVAEIFVQALEMGAELVQVFSGQSVCCQKLLFHPLEFDRGVCDVVRAAKHPETCHTILVELQTIEQGVLGLALEAAEEIGVETQVEGLVKGPIYYWLLCAYVLDGAPLLRCQFCH